MRYIKGQWQNDVAGQFLSKNWGEQYDIDARSIVIASTHGERFRRGSRLSAEANPNYFSNTANNSLQERIQMAMAMQHDVLTGLLNRDQFEICMQETFDKTPNECVEHALIYMDLDQFKVVNDACGHVAGDDLLRQIAAIIQFKVRKWDLVARLGGDEFAVELLYCNQVQAIKIADDISAAINQHRFTWQGLSYTMSASIGIVMVTADDLDAHNVMRKADIA